MRLISDVPQKASRRYQLQRHRRSERQRASRSRWSWSRAISTPVGSRHGQPSTTVPESSWPWRRQRCPAEATPWASRRTLRVIAWMDEENGGSGSQRYTKDHSTDFMNHVAAVESDSGRGASAGLLDAEDGSRTLSELLRPVQEILQSFGATHPWSPAATRREPTLLPACRRPGVPALLESCRMRMHVLQLPPHRRRHAWIKLSPLSCARTLPPMAVMGYALASMKDPLPR